MTVTLNLPHSVGLQDLSRGPRQASPNAVNASMANDRDTRNHQVAAVRLFALRLFEVIDQDKFKVASGATAWHSGAVIMDTGIRIRSKDRPSSSPLQVKFDIARRSISLVSEGKTLAFDIEKSAPLAMIKLAKVEAKLLEENKQGQLGKTAIDTKVRSGEFHQRMKPAPRVSPGKLAGGGYEFQIEAPAEISRRDGSKLQVTGTVTLETDNQGRPTRFMSAVSTADRVLAGSKSCTGPHATYLTQRAVQDALRDKLREMFPKEYQTMVSR